MMVEVIAMRGKRVIMLMALQPKTLEQLQNNHKGIKHKTCKSRIIILYKYERRHEKYNKELLKITQISTDRAEEQSILSQNYR